MNNLTPFLLLIVFFALIGLLAYLKRVKIEDLIIVYSDLASVDYQDAPGYIDSFVCPECGELGLVVDSDEWISCQECTFSTDDPDEIAPTLVDLFYDLDRALTSDTRLNGDSFTKLKPDSPEWMTDAIREAHGDKFPDDTIYKMVETVAGNLGYLDENSDADQLREGLYEIEPDIYTSDLTDWLNARPDHVGYLTEAQENFGPIEDGSQLLMTAQQSQIQEIGASLIDSVEEVREEFESEVWDLVSDLAQDVLDSEETDSEEEE